MALGESVHSEELKRSQEQKQLGRSSLKGSTLSPLQGPGLAPVPGLLSSRTPTLQYPLSRITTLLLHYLLKQTIHPHTPTTQQPSPPQHPKTCTIGGYMCKNSAIFKCFICNIEEKFVSLHPIFNPNIIYKPI